MSNARPFRLSGEVFTIPLDGVAPEGNRMPRTFAQVNGIDKTNWSPGVLQNACPTKSPTKRFPPVARSVPFRLR